MDSCLFQADGKIKAAVLPKKKHLHRHTEALVERDGATTQHGLPDAVDQAREFSPLRWNPSFSIVADMIQISTI